MSKYSYITNLRAIEEYIKNNTAGELFVFANGKRVNKIVQDASKRGIAIQKKEKKEFTHFFAFLKSEKIYPLVLKIKDDNQKILSLDTFIHSIEEREDPICILVLDQIKDPQNFGNIIRTCDQLAVDLVVLPEKQSVKLSDTVKNTSVGAYKFVDIIHYQNINSLIKKLKENEFWIYSSDMEGHSIIETDFAKRTCIIMGSEGEGIRNSIINECDERVNIPSLGNIESYNLASATAIILFEIRKKQGII